MNEILMDHRVVHSPRFGWSVQCFTLPMGVCSVVFANSNTNWPKSQETLRQIPFPVHRALESPRKKNMAMVWSGNSENAAV